MTSLAGRTAVVTGGTDGIGAATVSLLRQEGADVIAIGRSPEKAQALRAADASRSAPGSLHVLTRDFSLMRTVVSTVDEIAGMTSGIDLLVHAVGILITRKAHTVEGVELDLAVGYLSRFVFLEEAARRSLLGPGTRMVNIAASAPTVPRMARMEFSSLPEVEARTGMRSHGQAQLANDLLTAQAPTRYGITAVGYGPGAVDTSIRREVPGAVRALLQPFYARATRRPVEAARDVVDSLVDPGLEPGTATFRNRAGTFPVSSFVADEQRQRDVAVVSELLAAKALGA